MEDEEIKYTYAPVPWRALRSPIINENLLFVVCGDNEDHIIATITSPCDNMAVTMDNANRIVACVNACEGISNKALEDGIIKEMLDACLLALPILQHAVNAGGHGSKALKVMGQAIAKQERK